MPCNQRRLMVRRESVWGLVLRGVLFFVVVEGVIFFFGEPVESARWLDV